VVSLPFGLTVQFSVAVWVSTLAAAPVVTVGFATASVVNDCSAPLPVPAALVATSRKK
jgi:hypothetical protein